MSDDNQDPGYEVGYGRPPKASRFQKGRSGNPAGRPKGTLNMATVLERTLREMVVVNEGGRRRTITKLEAAVKQLVNKAAGGDLLAFRQLRDLVRSAEERPAGNPASGAPVAETDEKVLESLLKRYGTNSESGAKG